MLKLGKMTDYAATVLVVLAQADEPRLTAQDVSARSLLEVPTVSKLLKLLVHAGLVHSTRGAYGGYSMAKSADQITVADLIAAIEGPVAMTECTIEGSECVQESSCQMAANWQKVTDVVQKALETVSFVEMLPKPIHKIEKDPKSIPLLVEVR